MSCPRTNLLLRVGRGTVLIAIQRGATQGGKDDKGLIAALLAAVSLGLVAGTADAATPAPQVAAADSAAGTLDVQFAVSKFVVRGKKLVAVGNVIGTYTSAEGTTSCGNRSQAPCGRPPGGDPADAVGSAGRPQLRHPQPQPGTAPVGAARSDRRARQHRAHDQGRLWGGLLGGLLCGLAGGSGLLRLPTQATAQKLTAVAQKSGLAAGPGFSRPVQAPTVLPPVRRESAPCSTLCSGRST